MIGPSISRLARTVLLATPILHYGCTNTDASLPAIAVRDSAGITIVMNDLARLDATCSITDQPQVRIGVEEGPEEYQLFRVFGARRLSDGTIALVNQGSQQLRFYDQDGQFLRASGRRGEGPGEFRRAFHLWVLPGDTILVGDYRPYRYLVFSPGGQWQRNVQPDPIYGNPPGFGTVLDNGRLVLANRTPERYPGTIFEPRQHTVVVHENDGLLLDTIATLPMGQWGKLTNDPGATTTYPMFESRSSVTSVRSYILHGFQRTPQYVVRSGTDGFAVVRLVRWTTGDRTVSSSDVAMERDRLIAPYADRTPTEQRRAVGSMIDPRRPTADEFPAFSSIKGGRDGRVWVQEYPRPDAPDPQHWIAFAADGKFSCRATIPVFDKIWPPGSLLEFGADYILVFHRDELGVERVMQFGLGAPSGEGEGE